MSYFFVIDMCGGYGKVDILNGCMLIVDKGQIVVIVGLNGVGKFIVMKVVFGMLLLCEGVVMLGGQDIIGLILQECVYCGMGFVLQIYNIFLIMIVEENL